MHRTKMQCYVLHQEDDFFTNDGTPRNPFPNGWRGKGGLFNFTIFLTCFYKVKKIVPCYDFWQAYQLSL